MEDNGAVQTATKPPKVHISNDGLEATVTLPMPTPGVSAPVYNPLNMIQILKAANVTFGFDQEAISRLCDNPIYERPITVAVGSAAVQGEPGRFEFMFDLDINKKPVIREDGSTDYMNIKTISVVHKEEVIAIYHPAVQGRSGMSVRGKILEAKPVRDLPPLAGRGFTRSGDNLTYTSLIDGKIEMNSNRILISPVHEVNGNADISSGNIDFNGDVVVHGGACDGVIIRATGNVTIEGLVEACEIYAGKDLFLLSGIKGGEKTIIDAGGTITTQFIEYAVVTCAGNIVADYVFKSKVSCDGRLDLKGNKSTIIGGYISAVQGIDAGEIGNDFGTSTSVSVGVDRERSMAYESLSRKIQNISSNIDKIKKGLDDFDRLGLERGIDYKDDPRRLQLLRVKIRDEAVVLEERARLDKMKAVIDKGSQATIRVFKKVYSGVNIAIDDNQVIIKDEHNGVEFVKTTTGIKMEIML